MHRLRIHLTGPAAAVTAAEEAVEQAGGRRIGVHRPGCCVWSTADGPQRIADLSRRHPAVRWGVEAFEDFEPDVVLSLVQDGEATVLASHGLLPDDWGSFHDEDGHPLDSAALAWAGSVIGRRASVAQRDVPASGLATAVAVAEELGRFAATARGFDEGGAPTSATLDAIVDLGVLALAASVASTQDDPEREFVLAQRLTQSVLHAGEDEYREAPGEAEWTWWLGVLLGAAAEIVDVAPMADVRADPAAHAIVCDHCNPAETLELTARSLLTCCVQALVLFAWTEPARLRDAR